MNKILSFLLFNLSFFLFHGQTTNTWQGTGDTRWLIASNWSENAVPTTSHDVVIPDVSGSLVVPLVQDARVCNSLTIQNGGELEFSSSGTPTLTVDDNVTINSGGSLTFLSNTNSQLTAGGNWSNSGTFTEGTGTVVLSSASGQSIGAETFYNLYLSGGSTKTASGAINVSNDLTVTASNTILELTSNNLDVNGDVVVSLSGKIRASTATINFDESINASGGNIEFTGAGTLNLTKSVSNLGTFTEGNSTVVFSYAGTQALPSDTYYNLTVSGGNKTVGGNISVSNNLTVDGASANFNMNTYDLDVDGTASLTNSGTINLTSGTFDADGEVNNSAGTINISAAGNLILSNTVTDLGTVDFGSSSTVTYDQSGTQTIDNVTYNNLVIGGGNTKTAGNNLDVNGNLEIISSSTLDMNSTNDYALTLDGNFTITSGIFLAQQGNHGIKGNWSNSGTFTHGSGTVTFNGTGAQTIKTGSNNFYNLRNSNTSGNTVSLVTDDFVLDGSGTLTIDASSTFDLAGKNFNKQGGTVSNNGTFQMYGNETLNTAFSIPGNVKLVGTGSAVTLTSSINGLANLELTPSGSVTFTLSEAVVISGNLSIGSNATLDVSSSNYALSVGGNWTNSGTFVDQAGTVTFNGTGSQVITNNGTGSTKEFYNVTIDNDEGTPADGTDVDSDAMKVTGNLTVTDGQFQPATSSDFTNVTISSNGILKPDASASVIVSGTWTNSGTFTHNSGTITFDRQGSQVITNNGTGSTKQFYNVTIDNNESSPADGTDVDSDAMNVTGTLTVTDGQFQPATSSDFANVTISSNGILKPDASASITVSGDWTNSGTFTHNSGTVTFDLGNEQDLTPGSSSFYNLTTATTNNDVTIQGGDLTISNDLTIASSTTLDAGSNRGILIAGDWSNSGTFTAQNGTVTFNGSTAQSISGSNTFYDLTINNTDNTNKVDASSSSSLTVQDDLSISDGIFKSASDYHDITIDAGTTLELSGNITVSGTYINNGTLTPGTNKVTFDGSSGQSITNNGTAAGKTFYDLEINNTVVSPADGSDVDSDAMKVTGTLTVTDGQFQPATSSDFVNLTISTNGILKPDASASIIVSGTWTNSGTFTHNSGTITFDRTGSQVITNNGTGSTKEFNNVIIDNDEGTPADGTDVDSDAIKITGTLTISDGQFQPATNSDFNNITFAANGILKPDASATITVSGTWTNSASGTFTHNSGTVKYDGGAQGVASENYYNLTADQSGNKTAQGAINVANDMTISNSATYLTASYATDVTGATSVSAILDVNDNGGEFTSRGGFSATGNINFSGNGILRFITVSPTSLGTLDNTNGFVLYKLGADNVLADNYYNLKVIDNDVYSAQGDINVANNFTLGSASELNLGNNTFTLTGNADINGTLDFDNAGVFDANSNFDATGGTVQFTGTGGNLKLGGATVTSIGNTFDPGSGTVEYDYSGDQQVKTRIYHNLNLKGSGTKETPNSGGNATVTVENDLDISSGVTFDVATGNDNIVIQGDFTNSGTLTATDRSITFSGASSAGETSALINDASVDLIVDKTHSSGGVTFQGASSFDNVTITDGYLDIGAYTFTADELITISAAGTLKIPNNGTFNADGQLSTSGAIDFTGSGSQGDLICSSTSANTFGTLDDAAGTVTFDASSGGQTVPAEAFYNLTVNNTHSSGLTLGGNASVAGTLTFTAGDITTSTNVLTLGVNASAVSGATNDKHVNGFCAKTTAQNSAYYILPIGNGSIYRPLQIKPSSTSNTTFTTKYFHTRFSTSTVGSGLDHVSGYYSGGDGSGYYYDIQKSGSADPILKLTWTNSNEFGTGSVNTTSVSDLVFARWGGSQWEKVTSTPVGSALSGNVYTNSSVSVTNRYFTLASTSSNLYLPIDLVSFEGECINNQTQLEFVVASQVNNEYFIIERSKNLFDWIEISHITGGGTNNEEISYNFEDLTPLSGENYYRLSQTDIDGTTKFFHPIVVNCDSRVDNYNVFPNPTTNNISIEFELEYFQGDNIELLLRDLKGTIIMSIPVNLERGYNFFNFNLDDVPKGMYLLQYKGTKNHIPEKRLIKL